MGKLVQDAIKVKGKRAAVPQKEIMADYFGSSVPGASKTFFEVLTELEDYTKTEFAIKGKTLGVAITSPTSNAFNNCRGGWSEYIFAMYAWNELAAVNSANYNNGKPIYVYVKLPDNKSADSKWTATLDDKHSKVINAFDRHAASDEEVYNSGHTSFLLNSSNPDVLILKYSREEYDKLAGTLPLDPLNPISDLSLDTQDNLGKIFKCLIKTVAPRRNLHCFLSLKDSLKPDRRLQFLHEGNNVKTILLYLINERNNCDAMLKYDILHNKYYAVSFSSVKPKDRESLDAAMVACLTSPSLPKTWAVDKLFECLSQTQVKEIFTEIIPR